MDLESQNAEKFRPAFMASTPVPSSSIFTKLSSLLTIKSSSDVKQTSADIEKAKFNKSTHSSVSSIHEVTNSAGDPSLEINFNKNITFYDQSGSLFKNTSPSLMENDELGETTITLSSNGISVDETDLSKDTTETDELNYSGVVSENSFESGLQNVKSSEYFKNSTDLSVPNVSSNKISCPKYENYEHNSRHSKFITDKDIYSWVHNMPYTNEITTVPVSENCKNEIYPNSEITRDSSLLKSNTDSQLDQNAGCALKPDSPSHFNKNDSDSDTHYRSFDSNSRKSDQSEEYLSSSEKYTDILNKCKFYDDSVDCLTDESFNKTNDLVDISDICNRKGDEKTSITTVNIIDDTGIKNMFDCVKNSEAGTEDDVDSTIRSKSPLIITCDFDTSENPETQILNIDENANSPKVIQFRYSENVNYEFVENSMETGLTKNFQKPSDEFYNKSSNNGDKDNNVNHNEKEFELRNDIFDRDISTKNIQKDDDFQIHNYNKVSIEKQNFIFTNPNQCKNIQLLEKHQYLKDFNTCNINIKDNAITCSPETLNEESLKLNIVTHLHNYKSPNQNVSLESKNNSPEKYSRKCEDEISKQESNINTDVDLVICKMMSTVADDCPALEESMEIVSGDPKLILSEESIMEISDVEAGPSKAEEPVIQSTLLDYRKILKDAYGINRVISMAATDAILKMGKKKGASFSHILKFIVQNKHMRPNSKLEQDVRTFLEGAQKLGIVKMDSGKYFITAQKCVAPKIDKKQTKKSYFLRNKKPLSTLKSKTTMETKVSKTPKKVHVKNLRSRSISLKKSS